MSDAPLILGVSGLRGIVGESLTPEVAVRYAGAFGSWLREQYPHVQTVAVGRDGRANGEPIYEAVMRGIESVGLQAVPLGVVATPTVGCAMDAILHAGVVVTASHNPGEWNGVKCLVPSNACDSGRAPNADQAAAIVGRFKGLAAELASDAFESTASREPLGHATNHHVRIINRSVTALVFERPIGRFKAIVDSVNASGAGGAASILRELGVEFTQLFGDGSGVFPHTPEPTLENLSGAGGLCDAVPDLNADVGFAQDPDADRLAIVDEKGNYIGEEYTLVLCAAALMEGRGAAGGKGTAKVEGRGSRKPVFVVNLSTSRMIDDVAAHYGAEVVRTPVGEANVVEAMERLKHAGRDVVMGGEGNGGVIWPEVTYVRDSLSAMALTLALMARTGKTVSELVAMVDAMGPGGKGYCIVKRKAPLASKADAEPVVRHLTEVFGKDAEARVDTQDGVRIDWPARGVWAHVRASNTEPIMRVIVEAPTEPLANETAAMVESRIAEVRAS